MGEFEDPISGAHTKGLGVGPHERALSACESARRTPFSDLESGGCGPPGPKIEDGCYLRFSG